MIRNIVYRLLIFAPFFCISIAFCDEACFKSEEDFTNWITYYYQNPEPEKILPAIKYYCDSAMFNETGLIMPTVAFFAALFRNDTKLMEKIYYEISVNSSDNLKIFILNVLWLTNTTDSQELMKKSRTQWKSEEIQSVIEDLSRNQPQDILTSPIEIAWQLDMLWATFFATGDSKPVKKIISVLYLMEDKNSVENVVVGGAANWSLTSNAMQHKKVYEICKEELKTSNGRTKEMLEAIIKKVEELDK